MKHYIATAALCLMAAVPTFAQQTKRVMTVIQKNGTKVEYKVDNVQNVTFTDVDVPTLRNQVAYNNDIVDIDKVTMLQKADASVFAVYTADVGEPVLSITMPQSLLGTTVELGNGDAEGVTVEYKGEEVKLDGTLEVRLNKGSAIITLEAETADYNDLRCKYSKAYTQVYEATNTINVATAAGNSNFGIASALVKAPSTTGEATTFAFGDATATTAQELLDGKVGVAVGIVPSKLYNGTIDMASDADSYTFKYIDYASRNVYEKVKSGTITTAQDSDGKLYIKVDAVMDDNSVVSLEYYGATTEVESLDDMIPAAVSDNGYKYYSSDGDVLLDKTLGTSYIDEYNGNYTFYLVPEGESKFSSLKVTLKVSSDLINAGEVELDKLGEVAVFDLKFPNSAGQLQSYAAGHGYGYTPNNGTMTIVKNDDGSYKIAVDVKYNYTYKNYDGTTLTGGNNTHLVLNFSGTLETY